MDVINTIANNRFWNKHSVTLVWIIAVVIFVLVIMSVVWNAWSYSKVKQANYQTQNLAPIARTTQPSYRADDIVAANLFGNPTPAPVATVAPKTTLDLTLEGVLWASEGDGGRAIIMVGKKAAELYSVGEEINGANAKVNEIRDGEVILNRNGVLESLPLIKSTESGDRQIITFVDDPVPYTEDYAEFDRLQTQDDHGFDDHDVLESSEPAVSTPSGEINEARRVRRPNFSGLDNALEKMGEL